MRAVNGRALAHCTIFSAKRLKPVLEKYVYSSTVRWLLLIVLHVFRLANPDKRERERLLRATKKATTTTKVLKMLSLLTPDVTCTQVTRGRASFNELQLERCTCRNGTSLSQYMCLHSAVVLSVPRIRVVVGNTVKVPGATNSYEK